MYELSQGIQSNAAIYQRMNNKKSESVLCHAAVMIRVYVDFYKF